MEKGVSFHNGDSSVKSRGILGGIRISLCQQPTLFEESKKDPLFQNCRKCPGNFCNN